MVGCTDVVTEVAVPVGEEILKQIVVPVLSNLAARGIKALSNYVFNGGDTIDAPSQFDVPGVEFRKVDKPGGFADKIAGPSFSTPISLLSHGREFHVQFAGKDNLWSLVSGGANNRQVFKIHENWLNWLLYRDTCDFSFNGNTELPTKCWYPGCDVQVMGQRLIDASGRARTLYFAVSPQTPEHRNHSPLWIGCPTVEPGSQPEVCVGGGGKAE
jgi:hypothetical protein